MDNDNQSRANDPWANLETRYKPEQEVQGVVTRVAQFGVYVQLEPGIEGIVYSFELGSGNAALTGYMPGQEIHLYVKSVDAGRRRIELSPRQQFTPGLLEERVLPAELRLRKRPADLAGHTEFPLPAMLSNAGEQNCPTCQQAIQNAWKYCVYCGGSLLRQCVACGSTQPDLPGARFCCECGKPL